MGEGRTGGARRLDADTGCGGCWQRLDLIVDFLSILGAGEGLQFLWGVFNHCGR